MGCTTTCLKSAEQLLEAQLADVPHVELNNDEEESEKLERILVIGPGDSGKSTFCTQIRYLYTQDFHSSEYRMGFKEQIYGYIAKQMNWLVECAAECTVLSEKGHFLHF